MDIQQVIADLKEKFGDKIDVDSIKSKLQGMNLKGMDFSQIVAKLKADGASLGDKIGGMIGDLDGDGVQESPIEELKGKASQVFGNMFHKNQS